MCRSTDGLPPTVPPTASPTAAPASATSDKPDDEEEQRSTDGSVDNCGDNPCTKMNIQLRQQPVADEGANNSDYQVTNEAKSSPVDQFTRQPTGNDTNKYYYNEAFVGEVHGHSLQGNFDFNSNASSQATTIFRPRFEM
jgi:hypothetical protein